MSLIGFVEDLLYCKDLSNELSLASRKNDTPWGWTVNGNKIEGVVNLDKTFQALTLTLESIYTIKRKARRIADQSYRNQLFEKVRTVKQDIMSQENWLFYNTMLYEGEDRDQIRKLSDTLHRKFLEAKHAIKLSIKQSSQTHVPFKPAPILSCEQELEAISQAFNRGVSNFRFEWIRLVELALCDLHWLKLKRKAISDSKKIEGVESKVKAFAEENIEQCFCFPILKRNLSQRGIEW